MSITNFLAIAIISVLASIVYEFTVIRTYLKIAHCCRSDINVE
jgi:hypothetical protein